MAKAKADTYRAKESFVTMFEGEQVAVAKGDLFDGSHRILRGRDELFEPVERKDFVRFDVEEATAAPGRKRGDTHKDED